VAVLKLKGVASLWYENVQRQRAREGRTRIKTWSKLQKLIPKRLLSTDFEHDLYLRVSSSNQERLGGEKSEKECEPLQTRRGGEEAPKITPKEARNQEEEEAFIQGSFNRSNGPRCLMSQEEEYLNGDCSNSRVITLKEEKKITHLVLDQTVEKETEKEAATVLLVKEDTFKED